jgi:hypothetical protein
MVQTNLGIRREWKQGWNRMEDRPPGAPVDLEKTATKMRIGPLSGSDEATPCGLGRRGVPNRLPAGVFLLQAKGRMDPCTRRQAKDQQRGKANGDPNDLL